MPRRCWRDVGGATRRSVAVLLLLLLCLRGAYLRAQYVLESHEPASFSRQQLSVGPLRIIYGAGQDSLAQVVARWGAHYREATAFSPQRARRFPIVMLGRTVIPNGMVAWTPSRMELYTMTGGEDRVPVPCLQQLMSHEVRHYAQMEALDRGWIRVLYYFIGQQNMGVGALLPANWYFEGDAIHSESKYAPFGRAHSATHVQSYRADLLDGQELSYDQYRFRSFRYLVPNHYGFGTLMVESTVSRYGEQFWPRVIAFSVRHPYYIAPVHFALKRYTGLDAPGLFESAMEQMDSIFTSRTERGERPTPIARGEYRSERQPWRPEGSPRRYLWARDMSRTLAFVGEDTASGRREVLFRPGEKMGAARYGASVALWIEAERHPRWRDVVWGDVYAFRVGTGRRERITHRERLLSPVPLAGDSLFAAIAFGESGANYVVRCRLDGGRALDTAELPRSIELRELARGKRADEILVRGVESRGAYVLAYSWRHGSIDTLVKPTRLDIGSLAAMGDSGFFFTASHNSRQQAFFARRDGAGRVERFFRVAMRNHGVDDLVASPGGGLDYSEYTINGYRVRHADTLDFRPCAGLPGAQSLFPFRQELPDEDSMRLAIGERYPSRRYDPLLHAVRVHSWTPFYFNPFGGLSGFDDVELGAAITSQNALGTLAFTLGYFYKDRHGASFDAVWQGWWPVISVNATYGGGPRRTIYRDTVLLGPHSVSVALGAKVPLRFRRGAFYIAFTPSVSLKYRNDALALGSRGGAVDGIVDVGYGFSFSALRVLAMRDLHSRLGVSIRAKGESMVRPSALVGPLVDGGVTLYLPGIMANHSLRVSGYAAWAFSSPRSVVFSMPVRGLGLGYPSAALQTTRGWSVAVDYAFPLAYPDWSMGCVLYLKRLYANAAASYSRYASMRGLWQEKRVLHLDLVSDVHLLRFEYGFTLGVSVSYSPWGDRLGLGKWGPWSLKGIFNLEL